MLEIQLYQLPTPHNPKRRITAAGTEEEGMDFGVVFGLDIKATMARCGV